MLDRRRAFTRDLLSVFEKADGQRSDCPRCHGSGLFYRERWFWPWWNRKTHSNRPCWFCEGIGVMPLYGLQGFFLGRASTAFKTEELTNHPVDESPIKLHLYLGKYPGTRCRVGSFKNSDGMQTLLYNPSETPQWLVDAAVELAAATKAGENSAYEDDEDLEISPAHHDEEFDVTLRVTGPPHLAPLLDPAGLSCHFDPDATLDRVGVDLTGCPTLLATKHWDTAIRRGQGQDRSVGGRLKSWASTPVGGGDSAVPPLPSSRSKDKVFDKQSAAEEQEQGRVGERRWRKRNSRPLRQHQMREKEERESIRRALWIQGLKPSNNAGDTAASPPKEEEPSPPWSFSGRWKELSSAWIAEETALARPSVRAARQEAQAQAQGAPNMASTDQALFARLVDKLPPVTNFLSSLSW